MSEWLSQAPLTNCLAPSFRDWCNRQHARFWSSSWGFESLVPSLNDFKWCPECDHHSLFHHGNGCSVTTHLDPDLLDLSYKCPCGLTLFDIFAR